MEINLQNIEEIIFYNKKIQSLFPEFKHLFDQWNLSKRIITLQSLGKRTIIDLLNSLNKDHINKLENYFNDKIFLDKINGNTVYNIYADINNIENNFSEFKDFCITRNKDKLGITLWR